MPAADFETERSYGDERFTAREGIRRGEFDPRSDDGA